LEKGIKKWKREIIIGLIVSVITIVFIEPILKFIGNIIFIFTQKLFSTYNDTLYVRIAQNSTNNELFILVYTFLILIFLVSLSYIYIWKKTQEINNYLNVLQKDAKNKNEIEKNEITNRNGNVVKKAKKIDGYLYVNIILFAFFLTTNILSIATNEVIRQEINTYEVNMKIIRPYIPDKDLKIIDSQFHLMRNRIDYLNVINKINQVVNLNGLNVKGIELK
jgi:hypothetical protein